MPNPDPIDAASCGDDCTRVECVQRREIKRLLELEEWCNKRFRWYQGEKERLTKVLEQEREANRNNVASADEERKDLKAEVERMKEIESDELVEAREFAIKVSDDNGRLREALDDILCVPYTISGIEQSRAIANAALNPQPEKEECEVYDPVKHQRGHPESRADEEVCGRFRLLRISGATRLDAIQQVAREMEQAQPEKETDRET